MTTEEAIKNIIICEYFPDDIPQQVANAMYDKAIAALRAQQEAENPKPLTLDELREMIGEPVWLASEKYEGDNGWAICCGADADGYIVMSKGDYFPGNVFESGVVKAYRHKPKEKTK